MTTKQAKPHEREMTPGELAANDAHIAAHGRAVQDEHDRNEIIKQRIKIGDIPAGVDPSQLEVTPGAPPPRAADTVKTNAEQYGGAQGPTPTETVPVKKH